MSTSPSNRKTSIEVSIEDRRAGSEVNGAVRLIRWVKGTLTRPLGLERRGRQLHVVLVDRRRRVESGDPPTTLQLCEELRARLLTADQAREAIVMRHLAAVHRELLRRDWPGVEALASDVLRRAVVQAEMLASQEASCALTMIIDRLRLAAVAAAVREERQLRAPASEKAASLEVSESTHEEFEASERGWLESLPAEPAPPQRSE